MTPYERGQRDMQRMAAERCKKFAKTGRDIATDPVEHIQLRNSAALQALAADTCADYILSLPIEGEATNPGEQELPAAAAKALPSASREKSAEDATEGTSAQQPARPGPSQECVSVPREPKKGLLCGDVAISTDPRYAGWVFVRHVDGINWTTGAKLTPETWAMLAAREE